MDRAWNSQTQRAYWLLARWLSNYHHHEQELPITTRLSLSKLVKALVDVGIITGHLSSLASHLESIFAILKSGFFSLHQVRHSSSKFLITVNSLKIRQSSHFIVSLGPTFFFARFLKLKFRYENSVSIKHDCQVLCIGSMISHCHGTC